MSDASSALALAVLLVGSVVAPSVGAAAVGGLSDSVRQAQQAPPDDEVDYGAISDQLQALASVDTTAEVNLSDQRERAATRGARAGVRLAQQQGINVTQAQQQAAIAGATRAAAQVQDASLEQVQAAARGAAHGALLQSQRANVTQLQAGIYGASAGGLSQFQQANVTQLQSAAHGAAHGVVAQHQRANVSQLQFAAVGSAAGAARSAGQAQRAIVSQIQEAAQGSAYGSLVQRQNVTVTQIQAAAFGAAGGGAASDADTDPKKVQEAAMGAARGTLLQRQQVSITQIQSAARGACRGALAQSQNVTVTQIQEASVGAAHGALTQSQSATVEQVQAAAQGAASGVLVQIQVVNVVQIQEAAFGAARGAARTAAQQQIANVQQIQAAASGAAQGTIIQIQVVNIVQIQVVADSAASGALSQYQAASVQQIQSAALGASEGALLLAQQQTVELEQLRQRTERAAASTASIAADIDVVNEVTINVYARSAVTDPEPEPDEPERLRSLFAATDDETLFLANPNDVAATVTITRDGAAFETITLAPGESATRQLDPGEYALMAETADGRTVRLAGRTQLRFAIGDALRSLTARVDENTLTVENRNDQRVTVTVTRNGSAVATFDVPRDWTVSQRLDPGTYRVTATAADGRRVSVNGEDSVTVAVEPTVIDLNASLDDRALSVENPGDRTVTVRVDSAAGQRSFEVAPGATETVTLTPVDPVGHVVSGTAPDRTVLVNGLQSDTVFVPLPPTVDLDVGVEGQNVTIENPSDAAVTVTAAPADGANRTIDVPAGERVTTALEPGNYTLTGQADEGRSVRLNGQFSFPVTIEDELPPEPRPPVDLDVTVTDQNVTIRNPGPPAVTVTAAPAEADGNRTIAIPGNASVTEQFDPGNYTLTGESDDRAVSLNGEQQLRVTIEPSPEPAPVNLSVTVTDQNVTIENPSDTSARVTAAGPAGNRTIAVPGNASVTEQFDPGNYTLTGESDDRAVLLNGEQQLRVTIEVPTEPAPVNLSVAVDEQNVTLQNPSDTTVRVTAAGPAGNRTIAVSENATVTERFDPGNYTLTGESDDGRPVQFDGQSSLAVEIGSSSPTVDRTIESCRNITAPGRYELVGDIEATAEACIRVQSSDVIIDGNGNEIRGNNPVDDPAADDPSTAGIHVENSIESAGPDGPVRSNMTIEQIEVSGFRTGVDVVGVDVSGPENVTIRDSTVRANEFGIDLGGQSATVDNVTVESNRVGIAAVDGGDVTVTDARLRDNREGLNAAGFSSVALRSSVVADNAETGVVANTAPALTLADTVVRDNGGAGVLMQFGQSLDLTNATVVENGDTGVRVNTTTTIRIDGVNVSQNIGSGVLVESAAGDTSISGALIADNGGVGVDARGPDGRIDVRDSVVQNNRGGGVRVDRTATLSNVTLLGNASPAFDAREGTASATELRFGPSTTVAFEDRSVALDPVSNESLPAFPDGATAVGSGLNVTGLAGTAQLRFTFDATEANATVERWQYNGTAWTSDATDPSPGDGVIEGTIDRDGIYAPVRPPERLGVNVTVGNRVVWVANPTDQPVDVTVANATGSVLERAVEPGQNRSFTDLDPGTYTLTAATIDGTTVAVDGGTERQFTLPPELVSLRTALDDSNLSVTNPNELPAEVVFENDFGTIATFAVGANSTGQLSLGMFAPGNYTIRAVVADGRDVPIDDRWNLTITVSAPAPTETPTSTATPTPTQTTTVTATETATPTVTATVTATETTTIQTGSPTTTATATATETAPVTESLTATETATATATETAPPVETGTASTTVTETASPTGTETATVTTGTEPASPSTGTGPSTELSIPTVDLLSTVLDTVESLFD